MDTLLSPLPSATNDRRETRAAWMQKRRYLWRGFLKAVRAYQSARKDAGL